MSERRSFEEIRRGLLAFYDRRWRDLPWRRDADPYRIWVSEVMLQQTRVDTVIPYFTRWMERFPTLTDLADADLDDVLSAWSGLGYYARARNLHRAARLVRDNHGGCLPSQPGDLRTLPGIGAYTAGAIASIAFDRPEPAVDTNARRVLCRLFDLANSSSTEVGRLASEVLDRARPGDFNQAIMEFGGVVCTPRSPHCSGCPLGDHCLALARGTVERRPKPRRKERVPAYDIATSIIVAPSDRMLIGRRHERGLLGGMWEFPGTIVPADESTRDAARQLARSLLGKPRGRGVRIQRLPPIRIDHAFSHRRHRYHGYLFETDDESIVSLDVVQLNNWNAMYWERKQNLDRRPRSTVQKRIEQALNAVWGA